MKEKRISKLLEILIGFLKTLMIAWIMSLIAVLIMTLAFSVPLNCENYERTIQIGETEGFYIDVLEHIPSFEKYFTMYEPGTIPVADDIRGFRIADDHSGYNALENAMYCNTRPRYWHGYAAVMRILLLWFDYKEMRFLNLIFQLFLVILLFVMIRDKGYKKIAWLIMVWYALMMPISTATCLVYGYAVDAILISSILVARYGDKIWNNCSVLVMSFSCIGCVTCFFDLLIFSPIGWAAPVAMAVLLYGREDSAGDNLIKTIRSALAWVIGYGFFWFLKMLYAELILADKGGKGVIDRALDEALWSAGGTQERANNLVNGISERFSAVATEYKHYTYSIYVLVIVIITAIVACMFISRGIRKDGRQFSIMCVTLSPVIWVFVINAATKAHHIFDYRLMSTEICGALAMIILSLPDESGTENKKIIDFHDRKTKWRIILAMGCGIAGLILASCIKEDQEVKNADNPLIQDYDIKGTVVKMDFYPGCRELYKIGVSITPVSSDGEYSISLFEQSIRKDAVCVSASAFEENNWQVLDVDWDFDLRKKYEIEIKYEGDSEFGTLAIVPKGAESINEFHNLTIDGNGDEGQLVTWLCYKRRPSRKDMLIYGTIYSGFIAALLICLYNLFDVNGLKKKYEKRKDT